MNFDTYTTVHGLTSGVITVGLGVAALSYLGVVAGILALIVGLVGCYLHFNYKLNKYFEDKND
jgi:hypothetical protein